MQVDDPWLAGGRPAPLEAPPAGPQQPRPPSAPPPQHLLDAAARSHAAWANAWRGAAKQGGRPAAPRAPAKGAGARPPLPPGPPPRPRVCSWTARPHQPPKPPPLAAPYPRWPMPTRHSPRARTAPQPGQQVAEAAEKAAPTPRAAILVAAAHVRAQAPKSATPAVLVSAAAVAAAPPGAASAAAAAGMALTPQRHLKARLVTRRVNAILRHGGSGKGKYGPDRTGVPAVVLDASGAAKLDDLAANLRIDVESCRQSLVASKTQSGAARFLLQQLGDGKTYVWKVSDEVPQEAAAGSAAAGSGDAPAEPTAAGSAVAPAAEADAAEVAAAKSEPGSPPSEVDSYSDLPDFSAEVATMREVKALPATASSGEATAEAAPAQAKAPTQVVG